MAPHELSEKLLSDAGGWQAMKEARVLVAAGAVGEVEFESPLLKGKVREGGREYRAGLRICSRTNVENLCSCRASREWGKVCAHSLAVGLQSIHRQPHETKPDGPVATEEPRKPLEPVFQSGATGEPARLHVIVPPTVNADKLRDAYTVTIEVEAGGKRILLDAVSKGGRYRIEQEDEILVRKILEIGEGKLAGMLQLPRRQFIDFLKHIAAHPRIMVGRGERFDPQQWLARNEIEMPFAPAASERSPDFGMSGLTPSFTLEIEGSLNHLDARLFAIYGERRFPAGSEPGLSQRNESDEKTALRRMQLAGFSGPSRVGEWVLKGERAILRFLGRDLPRFQQEWTVSIGNRFQTITKDVQRISPCLEIQRSGNDWFELNISLVDGGGSTFSGADIHQILRSGHNYTRSKQGLAVFDDTLLEDINTVLGDCSPMQTQPGTYRISHAHAGYLNSVVGSGTESTIIDKGGWKDWITASGAAGESLVNKLNLGYLDDILREYQKKGVYWLHALASHGLGGILADEMGLGKTPQAIAFMSVWEGTSKRPSIVVCPKSLVFNWEAEIKKFAPLKNVLVLQGSNRVGEFSRIRAADIVLTSYPLLRRDIEHYSNVEFAAAFLDEAQHIKNPETQNALAAYKLKAEAKFVLTGTPLENSVQDLWAIMQFVLPGYLGRRQEFRERYMLASPEPNNQSGRKHLSNRIAPFLLRRKKADVLPEVPDKMIQLIQCEMTAKQKSVYAQLMQKTWNELDEAKRIGEDFKRRNVAFMALLRLRQACCDLRLLPGVSAENAEESAKLQMLQELVEEAIDGGHRMLVFSQFTQMLGLIIKDVLEKQDIKYCYLDGQIKDRAAEVGAFKSNSDIPVFLISLKTGGYGLNLTEADTVVHFEPWWNPSVEAQATDRVHRIGQDKKVNVYKLVVKDSVEEKILKLQAKKEQIASSILQDDAQFMESLTLDEMEFLLA